MLALSERFTAQRPTLREVLEHPFFTNGTVPPSIPSTAHDLVPVWHNLTATESHKNLLDVREAALLEEQAEEADEETPESAEAVTSTSPANNAPTVAQQEREFQKAVQPGSPISVLLQSAQQPLLVAPRDNENLIKRLTASRERDMGVLVGAKRANAGLRTIQESGGERISKSIKTQVKESDRVTTVENQKARIVAQMAATLPSASPDPEDLKRSKQARKALQSSSSGRVAASGSGKYETGQRESGLTSSQA
jgi:cell cycle serine/threonine-protein kinase CDC5/MSD2